MMTSSRPRNASESFASRRGHSNQLSISDPSHHVTEAIGTLYGESDDDSNQEPRHNSRPLSFIASPFGGEQIQKQGLTWQPQLRKQFTEQPDPDQPFEPEPPTRSTSDQVLSSVASLSGQEGLEKTQTHPLQTPSQGREAKYEPASSPHRLTSARSPNLSLRDVQTEKTGTTQFPLTNIDNPNDIAQELSNLQALRRMSMDVSNSADPDLMPFQGLSLMAMPSIAPTGEDDEGDLSRLLWVPAKVHPELAPDQFKNFLENRVQSIKRRSGDSVLSADVLQRNNSDGLRRRKSKLSRQVDRGSGDSHIRNDETQNDVDLEGRQERRGSRLSTAYNAPELSLSELVKDPSRAVQKLAVDSQRQFDAGREESNLDDDKPILPVPSMGLRRSTRTTYRKGGSLRTGDRKQFSKRGAFSRPVGKDEENVADDQGHSSQAFNRDVTMGHPKHVWPEPVATVKKQSRSANGVEETATVVKEAIQTLIDSSPSATLDDPMTELKSSFVTPSVGFDVVSSSPSPLYIPAGSIAIEPAAQHSRPFPLRSSSQHGPPTDLSESNPTSQKQQQKVEEVKQNPPPRSSKRPSFSRQPTQAPYTTMHVNTGEVTSSITATNPVSVHTLNNVQHSSPLLGSDSTRTDSLTFIPTVSADERNVEKKAGGKEEGDVVRSMSWKWFKSDDRDRKKKEKEKGRDKDENTKKPRIKTQAERTLTEKNHDATRLDVLQSSIDTANPKVWENLHPDRDIIDVKPYDEKKKESSRKSGEAKKERDGFFFGSIFGGSRRKDTKDNSGGKGKHAVGLAEPSIIHLRPDIDFPYTRFPIVEERAIYRMAHIKLANPRRDLRSQVLLSNFMYSYLAKVQAMHPQLNVPTSPQQKRQDEERKRREQELQQQQNLEQQMLMQQQESQSTIDQYSFEYHRATTQYGSSDQLHSDGDNVDYVDDAQIFEHDHGSQNNEVASSHGLQKVQGHDNEYGVVNGGLRSYYDYEHTDVVHRDNEHMW